jgi:hypothetical protein
MGRWKPGTDPAKFKRFRETCDQLWTSAQLLMAKEAMHNLTCSDPDCGGEIYPTLIKELTTLDAAVAYATIVMERMADMVSSTLIMSDDTAPETRAP